MVYKKCDIGETCTKPYTGVKAYSTGIFASNANYFEQVVLFIGYYDAYFINGNLALYSQLRQQNLPYYLIRGVLI